jgi:exodeoxyribonuclease VII large subunit
MSLETQALPIISVGDLNRTAREIIEGGLPLLWVQGEISNFSRPASGHWYFTLKDERAQVRCAMFRNRSAYCRALPKEGMQVQVLAQATLYEGRGEFQLIVEQLTEAGAGDLQARFEALKARLHAEGLFRPEDKRPIPRWPRRVAVITSPTGAAIHDILVTLRQRWPMLRVLLYPVAVQGNEAVPQILAALARVAKQHSEDVLIIARGGGGSEDLWAFNDEAIARAIRSCPIPVITGIGHEIDFTIADFAADLRAATPTAAAQAVSPDRAEWLPHLRTQERRLRQAMERALRERTLYLDHLRLRLRHPRALLDAAEGRWQQAHNALRKSLVPRLQAASYQLQIWQYRLQQANPQHDVAALDQHLLTLQTRLRAAMERQWQKAQQRCQQLSTQLDMLDPQAVLQRGYAVLRDAHGHVLYSAAETAVGAKITADLHQGSLLCQVLRREAGEA